MRASLKKCFMDTTFRTCLSWRTVVNHGSGFQLPGVLALCGTDPQIISSSSQSGSVPVNT